MKKRVIKIIGLLIFAILFHRWSLTIDNTWSYFSDTEIAAENYYKTGTLHFSLYSGQTGFVPKNKAFALEPCDSVTKTIEVRNEGSIPLFYSARFEKIAGDDDFCAYLELNAKLEGKIKYPAGGSKNLPDFDFSSDEALSAVAADNWQFKISLPEGASAEAQNKICEFNFVFKGRQDNFSNSETGFSDRQTIGGTIKTGVWPENNKKNACNGSSGNGNVMIISTSAISGNGNNGGGNSFYNPRSSANESFLGNNNGENIASAYFVESFPEKTASIYFLGETR